VGDGEGDQRACEAGMSHGAKVQGSPQDVHWITEGRLDSPL